MKIIKKGTLQMYTQHLNPNDIVSVWKIMIYPKKQLLLFDFIYFNHLIIKNVFNWMFCIDPAFCEWLYNAKKKTNYRGKCKTYHFSQSVMLPKESAKIIHRLIFFNRKLHSHYLQTVYSNRSAI